MTRPIMVAIGGDSGSGKASVAAALRQIFGDARCAEVKLDGYFALNRFQRNAVALSPHDPRAHDFAAMDDDLTSLSLGRTITKPVYDHVMGAIAGSETIEPHDIVLVQGRFPLYTQHLRSLFDVRVWLEREPNLTLPWTIHRDPIARGENDERVREAIERRRSDYQKYVAPQARHAGIRAQYTATGATFTEHGQPVTPDASAFDADVAPALARTVSLISQQISGLLEMRMYAVAI